MLISTVHVSWKRPSKSTPPNPPEPKSLFLWPTYNVIKWISSITYSDRKWQQAMMTWRKMKKTAIYKFGEKADAIQVKFKKGATGTKFIQRKVALPTLDWECVIIFEKYFFSNWWKDLSEKCQDILHAKDAVHCLHHSLHPSHFCEVVVEVQWVLLHRCDELHTFDVCRIVGTSVDEENIWDLREKKVPPSQTNPVKSRPSSPKIVPSGWSCFGCSCFLSSTLLDRKRIKLQLS